MKSGYDINRLQGDGYLILPLSMSRLADGHGQDPEWCYQAAQHFAPKLETYSSDVVLLYTYGLYSNTPEPGFEARKKQNEQALQHAVRLRKLIEKRKEFIPGAFHYISFEYIVLNSPMFSAWFTILKKLEETSEEFKAALSEDMMGREYNEPNINFLLEEIVATHVLRQHEVELPRMLVRRDIWRLLVYPGGPIHSDAYQVRHKILPQSDTTNPYAYGQYDYTSKVYNDYRGIDIPNS